MNKTPFKGVKRGCIGTKEKREQKRKSFLKKESRKRAEKNLL
jgi:hypothetical protein